jgi:NAD(P)-dependent dehydrogenase (short-subunit alcohol dehydrogenase family)
VETVAQEEARAQLEVNVFGLARMCQLVLPAMRRQGQGRIVNISSVAGRMSFPFGAWYCVSKYSVEALSDALRSEMKPFGVQVSIIEPGPIKTAWGEIAAGHLEESVAGTAYEERGKRHAALFRWAYGSNLLPKASVVTRAICRAALSRHPRARYRAGFGAGVLIFLHAILPARWWDALASTLF